jgi:TfoX/Sxy family transcriptional regulator of competence genes
MPYDEQIEKKIQELIDEWKDLDKKKMFGGICYLIHGNMCFGIYKDYLIVRCGVEAAEEKLKGPNTRPFDITGRAMKGWVMVSEPGWKDPEDMVAWLEMGREFALTLPAK